MSAAVNQFLDHARQAADPKVTQDKPRITFEGQSTFMKFCTDCHEQMPHIRRDEDGSDSQNHYSECVMCGARTYAPKAAASTRRNAAQGSE